MTNNAQRTLFDMVMANAAILHTDEKGKVIAKHATIPLELLEVDSRYQGDRHHKRTEELARNWNWKMYDMITVVPHYETCTLSVVNGQNRTNAARIKGITSLPAKILWDVTQDEEARLLEEAKWFVHQDDNVDKLKPVEKHQALLIMKDKAAMDLQEMLDKYDIKYVGTKGKRNEGVLGSYADNLEIARIYGKDCLEFIYWIIAQAQWNEEENGYSRNIVAALKRIYLLHDNDTQRQEIAKFLAKYLRKENPFSFMVKASACYPGRDIRTAMTITLDDILTENFIAKRAVYPVGEKKVEYRKVKYA